MAWIESHQTLGRHPKLMRLAGKLRIHRAQALGHLQYLWWWALDYAPTGDVSALAPAEISAASEWQGDPSLFQESLVECGWIDSDGKIHDWMDYAGRLVEERRKDAERKRQLRMPSVGCPPDVHRTSGVPNPTQPNSTKPNQKDKTIVEEVNVISLFDYVWSMYPSPTGKKSALRHFEASVKTQEDFKNIKTALENYLKCSRVKNGFVQNGSTWFNDWASWVSPTPEMMEGNRKEGSNGNSRIAGEADYIPGKYAHLSH